MSVIDYIEQVCRYDISLSDLVFLNFFINIGELSIDKKAQIDKMKFLKGINKSEISEWQIYQYDELCLLEYFWKEIEVLNEVEQSLYESVIMCVKTQLNK